VFGKFLSLMMRHAAWRTAPAHNAANNWRTAASDTTQCGVFMRQSVQCFVSCWFVLVAALASTSIYTRQLCVLRNVNRTLHETTVFLLVQCCWPAADIALLYSLAVAVSLKFRDMLRLMLCCVRRGVLFSQCICYYCSHMLKH
jgi:hypothetical protein